MGAVAGDVGEELAPEFEGFGDVALTHEGTGDGDEGGVVIGVEFEGTAGGGDGFGGEADVGVDPGEMEVRIGTIGSEDEGGFEAVDGGAEEAEGAEECTEIGEERDVFGEETIGAEEEFETLLGVAEIAGEEAEAVEGAGVAGLGTEDGTGEGFGFLGTAFCVEFGGFGELGGGVHGRGRYLRSWGRRRALTTSR
jgi:hypothetical protein